MNHLKDTTVKFAVVVVALAAVGAGVAWAQGQDESPSPALEEKPRGLLGTSAEEREERRAEIEAKRTEFLEGVAERLGVSVEELEEALKTEALEQIDALEAEGRLSERQAARARKAVEDGRLGPAFRPFRGHGPERPQGARGRRGPLGPGAALVVAADYLELRPGAVLRELRQGKSLAELAAEQGKSREGLEQALLAAVDERLDRAVDDERLTQGEAEELLERAEQKIDELVEKSRPHPRG